MATPTETELAQVWERVLQKDSLGPDDDFFLAGGDSLAAMQLVLAANERFNVELSIDLVFSDANTIRKMAAVIDERKRWPKTGRNPDLPVHAIDERIVRPSIGERSDTATRRRSNAARHADLQDLFIRDKSTGLRRMRPGTRFGCVQANAQGYRGPEIALEKPPGAIRFAFLGDSLTFGSWSGGNDTTWPHHVLETLRAASGGASYDYINAALPGNGIGELTIQFKESICKFRPDVVALAPAASGSVADRARARIGYSGVHYVPSRFARASGSFAWIEKNAVIAMRQIRALSDRGKLKLEPHELRELSREFEARLRELVTMCQKSGALVVLLTRESKIQRSLSRPAQIWASGSRLFYQPYMSISGLLDAKDEFNRVYRAVAAATGALLVDLVGTLPPTRAYFEDSSHCTPAANRMIGERVAGALWKDPQFQALLRIKSADTSGDLANRVATSAGEGARPAMG